MIEDFNGLVSIVILVAIALFSIAGYVKLNKSLQKNVEADEYYRDLL